MSTVPTQAGLSAEESAVLAELTDMYDSFLVQDRARFDSHLDEDVTTWETHLPGLVTRDELDAYRDGRLPSAVPRLAELRVEPQRIDVWGDHALARYELVAVPVDGAPTETTRVTDVLRRAEAGWRIIHHHAELWTAAEGGR